MIEMFHAHSPGYEITAWVNAYPPMAPGSVIEDGYEYGPYCGKPFALLAAHMAGADIAILLDAAFYPIRSIFPLVEHIAQTGYFLCKNGNLVGKWSSDRCLERMNVSRKDALLMEEASSYCVGLNFSDGRAVELLHRWVGFAGDRLTIPGPHTNTFFDRPELAPLVLKLSLPAYEGRNPGVASHDRRVKGHRHDQTVLSILAHRLGMNVLVERPKLTAYLGSETSETVLVNHGGL